MMKYWKPIVIMAIICISNTVAPAYSYMTIGDGTGSGNCSACHADRYEEDSEWHTDHQANAGGDCTTCHATAEGGGTVSTSVCSNCHANLPDEWVSDHEAIVPGTCTACHSLDGTIDDTGGQTEDCPAASLLGEDNPQLDTLRKFRDEVLLKIPAGQNLVKTYYTMAAPIISLCEKNPAIKAVSVRMLKTVIPVIEILVGDVNN